MRRFWHVARAAWLPLLLVAGLTACGSGDSSSGDATIVPENHAAVALHTMGSVAEATAAAQESGINFVCGTFPVPGQSAATDTSACMVSDKGVVAVIAFDSTDDMTYVLSGSAIDSEVTVPVDETDVYGVETAPGQLTLSIEIGVTVIGTVGFGA
ncbi:MAG: hypothetical protein MUQ27_01570 [Acidimicrobiia bacterium]|nr:hypothetical protein [Acidimicrobiia bacterium]